jgi:putative SOS response-associated peptidase YedK
MCGRFTQAYTWQEIRDLYDLTGAAQNLKPRYNIAPTQQIDVAYVPDNKTLLAKMRWGLIPPWWKKSAKDAVPMAVERRYDFSEFGRYLGKFGRSESWPDRCRTTPP